MGSGRLRGDQAVEGGHAGREEPARLAGHRARSCFSSWQEEEDSVAPGGPGWLWPVGHYSGGLHGKVPLFFLYFLFSIILQLCGFIKIT